MGHFLLSLRRSDENPGREGLSNDKAELGQLIPPRPPKMTSMVQVLQTLLTRISGLNLNHEGISPSRVAETQ